MPSTSARDHNTSSDSADEDYAAQMKAIQAKIEKKAEKERKKAEEAARKKAEEEARRKAEQKATRKKSEEKVAMHAKQVEEEQRRSVICDRCRGTKKVRNRQLWLGAY